MKNCQYCGRENPDDHAHCAGCGTEFPVVKPPAPPALPAYLGGRAVWERQIWRRMTLKQFATFWLRLQAVWLLFYAVVDATYLPLYLSRLSHAVTSAGRTDAGLTLVLCVVHILLRLAAMLALVQFSEPLLSWLIRDFKPDAPDAPENKTAAPPEGMA